MRHRVRGRKLGRTSSHRKAMFRNMACSLIRSVRVDEDDSQKPAVPGRIVTTVEKAKELRPFVEKLVTIARKAIAHERHADEFATSADRNSASWKSWRDSDQWNKWNQAIAPAVAYRRRAFAMLRDRNAVDILFDELAERFEERAGGYTRIVKLPKVRLGDAGAQALIEFVGERDRVRAKRRAPIVADVVESSEALASDADSDTASETVTEERPEIDATDETEVASSNVADEPEETASKAELQEDAVDEESES